MIVNSARCAHNHNWDRDPIGRSLTQEGSRTSPVSRGPLLLVDVDIIEISGDLELIFS